MYECLESSSDRFSSDTPVLQVWTRFFQTVKCSNSDTTTHAGTYSQCAASLLTRLSCMCGRHPAVQRNLYIQIPLGTHKQCNFSSCEIQMRRQTAHLCHLLRMFQNTHLKSFTFFPHTLPKPLGAIDSLGRALPLLVIFRARHIPPFVRAFPSYVHSLRALPSYVPSLRMSLPFVLSFYLYFLSCTGCQHRGAAYF